jgi:hypothetical protein
MFRGFRPLAQVANNCIDDFERNLDPIVNQERAMRRASYDSQDLQRQARNKILGKQNQFKRALGFQGTVTDSDGEILLSSTVVLSPMGVEFVIDEGDRQLILPYELVAIPEIDPISNILTAAVDDPRFQSFTVRGRSEDQISLWKADLDQLIELATT